MPDKDYALLMARYNLWQNESLIKAASNLSEAERQVDRGAFFGTIEKTFSHILWADRTWISRFEGIDPPGGGIAMSVALIQNWDSFRQERHALDLRILGWAKTVSPRWFEADICWFSAALGQEITKPRTTVLVQLFNHQTHHRGQIHAMLTAAGAKPEATDVPFMPDRFLQA